MVVARLRLSRVVAGTAVLLSTLLLGAVRAGAQAPTVPQRDTLSLASVYRQVEQTLLQPGMLYHATIQISTQPSHGSATLQTEQWVDGNRDVARVDQQYDTPTGPQIFTT